MSGPAEPVDTARRRRVLGWAIGAVVLALVVVVVAARFIGGSRDGYGDALRNDFVSACERASGEDATDTCRCAYDEMARTVPFTRFSEIDRALRDGGEIPSDIDEIVAGCR